MSDNFDSHKWFKKQYLEEAKLNESEEEFEELKKRLMGAADVSNLKLLHDMLRIVTTDLEPHEFKKEDVKKYINYYIDQI